MVNILLPIEIDVGSLGSEITVLGKIVTFKDTPLQISVSCKECLESFKTALQFREGTPQETVDVQILDTYLLQETLINIFKTSDCVTNTSVEQILVDHLSESLIGHFTKILGLGAAKSLICITPTDAFYKGLAGSIINIMQNDPDMRQYLYEQIFTNAPERFYPGKDDTYKSIPFQTGDSLAFYLQLSFQNAIINDEDMYLSDFLREDEMPMLRHIVILNIES